MLSPADLVSLDRYSTVIIHKITVSDSLKLKTSVLNYSCLKPTLELRPGWCIAAVDSFKLHLKPIVLVLNFSEVSLKFGF